MKKEAPQAAKLSEQSIREAANAAVHDLQLDVEVERVAAEGETWCVHFTADYRQFCDGFRDQFGKENGFELMREKIKRHILKQQQNKIRAGVRVRRGRAQPRPATDNFLETAVKTIEDVASQAVAVAGELINQAVSLPQTALKVFEAAAEIVSPAAEPSSHPAQKKETALEQPLARVRVKTTAAAKSSGKSSSPARRATSKKSTAARKTAKAATKRTKRAASKFTSKSSSKKSRTKKSAGKK